MSRQEPISTGWVLFSFCVFVLAEVFLGGWLAPLISGFVSRPLVMRVEVILMLSSFALGGFVVGFISPTVRVTEPALGAVLAVGMTFLYSVFMPVSLYVIEPDRLAIGAAVAFAIAGFGADAGERLSARLGNRASQAYLRRSRR